MQHPAESPRELPSHYGTHPNSPARTEKVSWQSIGRWRAEFLEAGRSAVATGRSGPSTREEQLEAQIEGLTQALGEAVVELRVRGEVSGGQAGPFEDLEVIRVESGMSTTRFCRLFDMPSEPGAGGRPRQFSLLAAPNR